MTSKFIVLANGEINNPSLIQTRLAPWSDATVIAADGGYRHAEALGLRVNVLIGDMDSVREDNGLGGDDREVSVIEFPQVKDETDLELALMHAANLGADEMVILGAHGGRLDMTLANLLLLTHPRLSSIHIEIWADIQTVWFIHPPGGEIAGEPGDTVSLLPLLNDAIDITTTNLAYALTGGSLLAGEVRGVSNVMTDKNARIDLGAGTLLVVHTHGHL